MPKAQERRAGRSAPESNYSHEAVSVTSLGHHLPAVTQPASPKVKSQPRLDVTAPLSLPHQVPRETSCLYTSHSRCRSMVFQGLPTQPSSGSSVAVKSRWVAPLFGRRLLDPGARSSSPGPAPVPGLHRLEARSAGVRRYFISNEVPKSLSVSGLCSLLTQGVFQLVAASS